MTLESLGWSTSWSSVAAGYLERGLVPLRIAREDRGRYTVLGVNGEGQAVLAGRFRQQALTAIDRPAVGDWVVAREGGEGLAMVTALLPRRSAFVRKEAGETSEAQVVAANVDAVFLVCGLDGDLNVRRIERYVASAYDSGAAPVLVLNKADLARDPDVVRDHVAAAAPGVPIVTIAALTGSGLDTLGPWLVPGNTVALLGSSGVGKSTIVNMLVGEARQATSGVREADSRGRHTTTHRELVALPSGAWLIDTPGMRELQLWADEDALGLTFPEVASLASRCRFRDCKHEREPHCAVRAALADGSLEATRFAAWGKLQREIARLDRMQDARARAAAESRWKAVSKSMRKHPKAERWKRH